jgi:hypothetical protein
LRTMLRADAERLIVSSAATPISSKAADPFTPHLGPLLSGQAHP